MEPFAAIDHQAGLDLLGVAGMTLGAFGRENRTDLGLEKLGLLGSDRPGGELSRLGLRLRSRRCLFPGDPALRQRAEAAGPGHLGAELDELAVFGEGQDAVAVGVEPPEDRLEVHRRLLDRGRLLEAGAVDQ